MSDHRDVVGTSAAPLARAIASALSKPGLIAAAAGIALSPAAFAATYTVGNLNDSGAGSLRDAIQQANANAGDDIITFASNVSGTISLTSGSLYIYGEGGGLNVQGPGASVVTIAGNTQVTRPAGTQAVGYSDIIINGGGEGGQERPSATLAPTPVTFSGLTITGGSANFGGGINAYNALLNVNNCVVTGNYASQSGGGIYISGYYSIATISGSTLSNNSAYDYGGAIATEDSKIVIQQSSLTGNSADSGGAIYVHNDNYNSLSIASSTISGNTSNDSGGGIFIEHTGFDISNSTIANNTSGGNGGGLYAHTDDYSATIANSTISGNHSNSYGGGILSEDVANIVMTNTVVAGNTATGGDPDTSSSGGTFEAAFSLIGIPGAATITNNGGNLNGAAQLGALANNGGPTQTMLPLTGSPLINAGDPAFSGLSTDQRGAGFPRIVNGRVDIGAVEGGSAVVAAETVPAPGLGLGGQLGLGALLGLAGLAVARRRRNLGGAAGLLLAATLSVSAPNLAQAAPGHESRSRAAVTVSSYSVQDKMVTVALGDGKTLTVKQGQVRTIDKRSSALHRQLRDPSGIASGTPAAVTYETGKDGQVRHVRIVLADSMQQAQALLARKP